MRKLLPLAILIPVMFNVGGCTPILWAANDVHTIEKKRVVDYSDSINAAFEYKNTTLSTNSETNHISHINLPPNGIGFIGDENVYFFTKNGELLLSLNELMKKIPLRMMGDEKYINIDLSNSKSSDANASFHQHLIIRTRQSPSELSRSDRDKLTQLLFTVKDDYYERVVEVEGIIINKKRFGNTLPPITSLHDSYRVRFYKEGMHSAIRGDKLAFNIAMTPVTLTGDIILLPVYLLMLING